MILDKNGKIGGKISIIDLAVIILIIAVACGIGIRYGTEMTKAVKSNEKFECVIRVSGVRKFTVDGLQKMGDVTDNKFRMKLGEIKNVEVEQADSYVTTADGKIKVVDLPDRYTCYVTIEYTGKESDDGYIIDDSNELSVGRYSDLITKYVSTSGDIMSVKVVE